MRIKQISVNNLFGIFNHVIPMNMEERITIIHGKNGFGKTALLRMINGVFNLRYSELRAIPFDDFLIEFDDGSHIRVNKKNVKGSELDLLATDDNDQDIIFYFTDSQGIEKDPFSPKRLNNPEIGIASEIIEEIIPETKRIGPKTGLDLPAKEVALEDYLKRFYQFYLIRNKIERHPEWLENIRKSIQVRFIESQRLLNLTYNSNSRQSSTRQHSMIPSVATYAEELAESIQAKLAEYGTLAQSLDRTFPARVVQQKALALTDEKLRNKLNELEEKRSHLINTGLLDKDENSNFQVQEQIDESTKKVLSVYVEDVENKLSVFKEIAQRIDILKRIINQRFSYKQITISKDKGFIFTCDGKSLSPTDLSSGEQHELVILYELLFKVEPNSLILIDEPELSLHVEWQVQFLKDLQEITKLADLDILIATHSPDLIHDRWDLTVQLKGPNE